MPVKNKESDKVAAKQAEVRDEQITSTDTRITCYWLALRAIQLADLRGVCLPPTDEVLQTCHQQGRWPLTHANICLQAACAGCWVVPSHIIHTSTDENRLWSCYFKVQELFVRAAGRRVAAAQICQILFLHSSFIGARGGEDWKTFNFAYLAYLSWQTQERLLHFASKFETLRTNLTSRFHSCLQQRWKDRGWIYNNVFTVWCISNGSVDSGKYNVFFKNFEWLILQSQSRIVGWISYHVKHLDNKPTSIRCWNAC